MSHNKQWNAGERRFNEFRSRLRQATGDRCYMYAAGRVGIWKNEFSPARDFSSLQTAIDHFAYLIGSDI